MKRTALLLVLLVAYASFFGRRLLLVGPPHLDPLAPQARQVEQAIAAGRFAEALPVALELGRRYDRPQPLACYWLALVYHGLDRPQDEAGWWEAFMDSGGAAREACPDIADAYARLGDSAKSVAAYTRCATLDGEEPERLIDLGDAAARAGQPGDAMAAYRRAAALDARNPVIARRIERMGRESALAP